MEDKIGNIAYFRNGGIMIPKEAYKLMKKPYFKIWSELGYWHIKIIKPSYPKIFDKTLRILCKYGVHRWVGIYGFRSWMYDTNQITSETKEETCYQCARCKKIKTIPITT